MKWQGETFNAEQWDTLNEVSGNSPCLDSANVLLLMEHFGTGRERVMVCRIGGVAVAMTVLEGRFLKRTFSCSQQPLSLWVQRPDVDFEALVTALSQQCWMLSVMHLDPDIIPRSSSGTLDYIETTCLTIDAPFADYWATRRNLRDNDRKGRNRLAKAGIATRLEAARDAASIGAAVDDYGRLESAGWKGASAIGPDNAQGRYYRELFETYAARGMASVWRYFYGDKLVACDLCVHRAGTFVVLKTTYDESEKNTSPSQLMRREMMEQLFADGQTRVVEFYGRTMQWHRGWSDEQRTMYHVNTYRAAWVRAARDFIKRVRQPRSTALTSTPAVAD